MKTKKQLTKRILSLVLTLVMVVGMLPSFTLTANAATEVPELSNLPYIDYTDGATQYFKYDNYLYKVKYTNFQNASEIGLGRVGTALKYRFDGWAYSDLMNDAKNKLIRTTDLPKSIGVNLSCYSEDSDRVKDTNSPVVEITCVAVDKPSWNWSDLSSPTATFTVTNTDVCATVKANIDSSNTIEATNCLSKDQTIYTASATFNGQTYTDTHTVYGDPGPHNYTYFKTSDNTVTEKCANCNNHNETAQLVLDETVSRKYTGSEIKPLKVEYSDGWQGGTLDITYQNNTAVSTDTVKATGSIAKGTATATLNFTITKGTMSGISVNGYSGVYDGKEHSISITNVPSDATVKYSTSENGTYTSTNPTYKDKGSYTVWYKIEKENYEIVSGSADVVISQAKLTIKADDISKTYGESDPTLTWKITEGSLAGADVLQNISISREEGNDADSYVITVSQTEGSNPNYDITFEGGTFTINQKEIGISWGATEFIPYTGELIVPQATATGLESGDVCILTTSVVETTEGAGIIPGRWHVKVISLSNDNYCLPKSGNLVEVEYGIVKGYVDAPIVSGIDETIKGRADGKINGLTTTMEYATEYTADDDKYTKVTDANMTFAAGTYFVRYQAAGYYNASPFTEVTIKDGGLLNVSVPATQTGYTLTVADTELVWNGNTTLTFELANGYSKTDAFTVKVNGDKVELDANGKYVITNAQENITIAVEGVADTTAPTAEITLATNKWNTFLNNITFGLFFKKTQSVTITAEDVNIGSGLEKVYYYLATEELTEDEVKALADWEEYNGVFSINPNNEYIIYAKVVDKAGNAAYISSEGIVLDAIVPVIIGVENDGTYYGNTQFSVDESYIDTVIVDESNVNLTDGKYTITADGKEHTIVVTDKAGNSATVKVTVITIASLDDTIENIKTTDVKSTDKEDIQEVLDFVNSLINSGKDFTDEEDEQLSEIKSNAESLLEQIDDTAAETKDLADKVDAYDEAKVTSDDKQTITDLVAEIDELLEGDNLTEEEKETLAEVKADAEALIKKIDDAAAATDTENTEKVKDVTDKTVTPEDKTDLEKAKEDLEKALEDHGSNMTEGEKKAIEDEIKRIDDALEVIGNVEAVEELIDKLPDTIKKDDEAAIKAADDAYNALSDYEKSLVDKDAKKSLDDAKAAIAELNKPADTDSPQTGDNSNMFLWIALLFISGGAVITLTVVDRKRRTASKR